VGAGVERRASGARTRKKNSTIVFPLPMDIVAPLLDALKRGAPASA